MPGNSIRTDLRPAMWALWLSILCCSSSELQAQFDDPNVDPDALPTVPAGFRVSVFAREPLVRQPCSIAFDTQGRLFIGMGPQYRNPTPDTPGDCVVLLQDHDGDGAADHAHTFATGFNAIQGLAWKGRDLWIANAPDLTVVRDLDGDDTADEYVRIYTDLGNLEHGLHGLNWAPDGRLYMSKGNSKGLTQPGRMAPRPFRDLWGVTAPDGTPDFPEPESFTPETYRRAYHDPADDWGREGGILRCEDGGKQLEIVATGFRNPWDITADHGFNWLGTDNDQTQGDRVIMPFSGAHFGWNHAWSSHWSTDAHPPTAPVSGPLFEGSGTGLVYYNAPRFPESWRGGFFINDWLRKTTFFWRPTWDGALMRPAGGDWVPFVEGGQSLFRPTDLEVGPDGALWILGWSRGYGAEWNDDKLVSEGRVFRVEWTGTATTPRSQAPAAPLKQQSLAQLLDLFSDPIPARRIDAQEELLRRGETARQSLLAALNSADLSESSETWIAWTLGRMQPESLAADQEFVRWLASDSPPARSLNLRIQAIRILADRIHRSAQPRPLPEIVISNLSHPEPRVRIAAVLAIRETAESTAVKPLLQALAVESDPTIVYAGWQTLRRLATVDDLRVLLGDSRPSMQQAAFLALAESGQMQPAIAESLTALPIARIWLEKQRSGSEVMQVRGRPLSTSEEARAAGTESAVESAISLIRGLHAKSTALYQTKPGALRAGALVFSDRDYTFRQIPDALLNAEYIQTANNDDGSAGADFLTFEALLPVTVYVALDTRQQDPPAWLATGFQKSDMQLQADHWTLQVYRKDFPAGEITLGGNTNDGTSGGKSHYTIALQPQIITTPEHEANLTDVIKLSPKGDPGRGEVLFRHPAGPGCFKCHSLDQQRNGFGPALGDIGRRSAARLIAQSIVEPDAVITEGFQLQVVVTTEGKQYSGVLLEESGLSVTLGLSTGERLVLGKDIIDERRTERTSAMPSMKSRLSSAEIADLTAFLLTQQKGVTAPASTATEQQPAGVEIQPDRLLLSDVHGPIGEFVFNDPQIRRPYLTRLKTMTGRQVTRNHPPVEGVDATDHETMHPGIWLGFGDFAGTDFWRNLGTIEHVRFSDGPQNRDGVISFTTESRLLSEQREELGTMSNRLRIHSLPDMRLIVWEAEFGSSTRDLVFGDQEEMGFGARVATAITEKNGGQIRNSSGQTSAATTWGQAADWCDYSGTVDGRAMGITLMGDPQNFRRSWWHNRDYGVFVANPFGRAAMKQGAVDRVEVPRGQTFRLRFGAVLHDGPDYSPHAAWEHFLKRVQPPSTK